MVSERGLMMQKSERTKGPWRKGRDDMTTLGNEFDGEWCKYVYSGDPARAHTDTGVCTVLKAFGDTQEEAHGNARLAAAAVNAADDAGLSVDFLESGGVKELVKALHGLLDLVEVNHDAWKIRKDGPYLVAARALLARLGGGA